MKVLWITFAPIGRCAQLLRGTYIQGGGWIDATLNSLLPYIADGRLTVQVVALDPMETTVVDGQTGVTYRTVNVTKNRGKRGNKDDRAKFKSVIDDFSPDVIQIWGTEFTFGLDILAVAENIPVCFYVQSVMNSLVKHPLGDLNRFSLFVDLGITSVFKFRSLRKLHRINTRHLALEAEMIRKSSGLVVDNEWTLAQYSHCTDKFYFVPLASNSSFREKTWNVDDCDRHTLFTVAGGSCPQKGIHDAVLAVARLKDKYPDVKLYIPGAIPLRRTRFSRDSIFIRHIRLLIKKYGLENFIYFTGRLNAEQMAEHMIKANAFVMPSSVEAHSSSLREAMLVGIPCITSCVGSIPEFVHHGENGFLYRYGEFETLAYYIDRIFSDDSLAENLGASGKRRVSEMFPQDKIGVKMWEAYCRMMEYVK